MPTKTEVLIDLFLEMGIEIFGTILFLAIGCIIVFIIKKIKLRSIKSKFKRDYSISLPSDTTLVYRRCGSIQSSYGNKITYYVFKFKKKPALVEKFKSINLQEGENADELKGELKKYFDSIINGLESINKVIDQKYLPNWDNEIIWNDDVFPAIYYSASMEMIVCISTI